MKPNASLQIPTTNDSTSPMSTDMSVPAVTELVVYVLMESTLMGVDVSLLVQRELILSKSPNSPYLTCGLWKIHCLLIMDMFGF